MLENNSTENKKTNKLIKLAKKIIKSTPMSWNTSCKKVMEQHQCIPGVVVGNSSGGDAAASGGNDGGDGGDSAEGLEKGYVSYLITQLGATNIPPCFPLQHNGI